MLDDAGFVRGSQRAVVVSHVENTVRLVAPRCVHVRVPYLLRFERVRTKLTELMQRTVFLFYLRACSQRAGKKNHHALRRLCFPMLLCSIRFFFLLPRLERDARSLCVGSVRSFLAVWREEFCDSLPPSRKDTVLSKSSAAPMHQLNFISRVPLWRNCAFEPIPKRGNMYGHYFLFETRRGRAPVREALGVRGRTLCKQTLQ